MVEYNLTEIRNNTVRMNIMSERRVQDHTMEPDLPNKGSHDRRIAARRGGAMVRCYRRPRNRAVLVLLVGLEPITAKISPGIAHNRC